MTELPIVVMALQEWLSERARRERHALVLASAIGLTVSVTGLLPTKISALGIEFSIGDQAAMLKVLASIVAYLLTAFGVHAFADYTVWRTAYQSALLISRRKEIQEEKSDEEHMRTVNPAKNKRLLAASAATPLPRNRKWASRARDGFDVWVPVVLAVLTIVVTLRKAFEI
jgi:hypothetical protein